MTPEQTPCDRAFRAWFDNPANWSRQTAPPSITLRAAFLAGFRAGSLDQTELEQALRNILLVLDTEYTPEEALRLIAGIVGGALKVEV